MICQCSANKERGLLWEFVGGKVGSGEIKEQALIRECKEELNVLLSGGDVFMDVVHEYPELMVRCFAVSECPPRITQGALPMSSGNNRFLQPTLL